jgi:DNA-binding LytR/AlgR family response regulator
MSISCFIVDDQRHGIDSLIRLIGKVPDLIVLGSETDAILALNRINTGLVKPDLLFLDVDMPELNGIEFSRHLIDPPFIIYVTGHRDYAIDAIGIGAIDYLLKPIEGSKLLLAVERAKERIAIKAKIEGSITIQDFVFVKLDSRNIIQVSLDELVWIKSDNKYLELHIKNAKPLLTNNSLNRIEEVLPRSFVRVHKSYIVNLKFVDSIVLNKIILKDGPVLEIGKYYNDYLMSRISTI